MKDKNLIDKQEALGNKLEILFRNETYRDHDVAHIMETKPSSNLIALSNWVKNYVCVKQRQSIEENEYWTLFDNKLVLFDSSMQIDGAFVCFCEENNFKVTNIITEAMSVLSYSEKDFDPFILHGLININISNDFNIIKSSLLYNQASGADNVSSFIIIEKKDYNKYIELKTLFIKWLRAREGTVVKVINGEDYLQDISYNWNDLFFGEKTVLKNDLKKLIDNFFQSEEYYRKNNIPWHMSIMVEGAEGCGKTTLINTIMSEYDLEPVTLNFFNTDDSVLKVLFDSTEDKHKSLVFIDNVDNFIDQQFITQEYLHEFIEKYNSNNGNILLFTCNKIPDIYKDLTFGFDKIINIGQPDYNNCISNLFGKYITQSNIKDLQKICLANELSYGYIYKTYKIFMKNIQFKNASKKKDVYTDLTHILTSIIKEDDKLNKSRTKKISLVNKK